MKSMKNMEPSLERERCLGILNMILFPSSLIRITSSNWITRPAFLLVGFSGFSMTVWAWMIEIKINKNAKIIASFFMTPSSFSYIIQSREARALGDLASTHLNLSSRNSWWQPKKERGIFLSIGNYVIHNWWDKVYIILSFVHNILCEYISSPDFFVFDHKISL